MSEAGRNGQVPDPERGDHEVEVVLRLTNRQMGVRAEREAIVALEDALADVLDRTGVGELEGDEFGDGQCVLFFTGPDADRLFATLQPHLQESDLCRGAYAIKRFGADEDAPQQKVRI